MAGVPNTNQPNTMAISSNGSYLTTADTFIAHWQAANAALPPGAPVITAAGAALADLQDKRADVDALFANVTAAINNEELSRATLATRKEYVRYLCVSFNEAVRGRLSLTSYPAALPQMAGTRAAPEDVIANARDVSNLWGVIDASGPVTGLTPPLVFQAQPVNDPEGDSVPIDFTAFGLEMAQLDAALTAFKAAQQNTRIRRDARDREKRRLADIMRDYRAAVPGFFSAGDPIRESLPDLYPAPGHTPDAVVATGGWDIAEAQGRIAFGPSDDADLDRYAIRHCPGAEYDTEDEITLGTVEPAGPLEFLTLDGLPSPGSTGLYRVYVVLTTGNEKGSNTVAITRPLP